MKNLDTNFKVLTPLRKKTKSIKAVKFPDDAISQSSVYDWINENGGQANLYDGFAKFNVKTSTGCEWQYEQIAIKNARRWANIGDWIVKEEGGFFSVYSEKEFFEIFDLTP